MLTEVLVILALILANGLLSGAEMAVVSVRRSRLQLLVAEGHGAALALQRLRRDPERFLATVQVGITVVGAAAAAFGGASFAEEVSPWLARVSWIGEHAESVALAAIIVAISYLSLVLGELVPKSLALRHSERYALFVARPLLGLTRLGAPVVWLLTKSSNVVLKPFHDSTTFVESRLSRDEIQGMVEDATKAGSVDPETGDIAARALELGTLTAEDVMVHRRYVVGLSRTANLEELKDVILVKGHRRIPIHGGSLDNVLGYVSWRDVVARVWSGQAVVIDEILRPCRFVPETKTAIDLLRELQEAKVHLAIVVDEHGGTSGIVTLEDLLEELVGEIVSEHDKEAPQVHAQNDGSWIVLGSAHIRDVAREIGIELPGEDESTTISGLCVQLGQGRIPSAGEVLLAPDGTQLEVLEASARRVRRVRVRVPPKVEASAHE